MKEEVKKQDPVEVMITTQIERFSVKTEELQKIVEEYSKLEVKGVDDKAGRKAISEARKHFKRIVNDTEREGKEFRENFNKVSKAIIAREKEIISIVLPGKQRLEQIESDIAEEEEELERIRLHEEQERIIARTKQLDEYGAAFNGVQYELGDNIITMAEVRLFTDIEFTRKISFFKEDYENFKQLELQAAIERQTNLSNNKEAAILHIQSLGYVFEKDSFYNPEFNHRFSVIRDLETEDDLNVFKKEMDNIITYRKEEREKAEAQRIADEEIKAELAKLAEIAAQQKTKQAELDRKQKELDDQLAAVQKQKEKDAADKLEQERKESIARFENRRETIKGIDHLLSPTYVNDINSDIYQLSEADFNSRLIEEINKWGLEQDRLAKEAKEKAAAEEKRRIEMQPDVELLKQIAVDIKGTIVDHNMKTEEGKKVLASINELKSKTVKYIEEQIKSL